jgi:tRNA (guanine-N7-)-methyltransferase
LSTSFTPAKTAIRSFVRREGRFTRGQRRAIDTLWERYGVNPAPRLLDLDKLFGRCAPHVLEIGFGNGESLAAMAQAHPQADFLGIEVHRPGIGHLLMRIEALGLSNLRVICADAVEVIQYRLPDTHLDRVQVFFPDPWPKQRHHKRRLIQPAFLELLAPKLKPGGYLHLATDWEDYALYMLKVLEASKDFVNAASAFAPHPYYRPLTKFEQQGLSLGHNIWDLLFQRRMELKYFLGDQIQHAAVSRVPRQW